MLKTVLFGAILLSALSTGLQAQIHYQVMPSIANGQLQVIMRFKTTSGITSLQMPSWLGSYVLRNSWSSLKGISVTDNSGHPLVVDHPSGDSWSFKSTINTQVAVYYEVPLPKARFNGDQRASDSTAVHYGGLPVYLYVIGRKRERCILELVVPREWKTAAGLTAIGNSNGNPTFFAKNYDELLDNPITTGEFVEQHYEVSGKDHIIALRGPASHWVDYQKTLQMTRFVTQIESDFFGGLPYQKYVWHCWVYEAPDMAGGTEHASSVEMHLTTEEGPEVLQGMAHEFFHLWNVKRIRPRPLGPFDYTQLPKTGALWWMEGVTDYYSMLLPYRYGAWNEDIFFRHAKRQIQQVRQNPARMEVSPYDASYKISAENGNYYKVNYYPTGWVLGMMFDIEIRASTAGKHSLDDVMLDLWKLCRNDQPGFAEGEIRRLLVKYGGPHMGPLYDSWVLQAGELPVEQELAKVGLMIGHQTGQDAGTAIIVREGSTSAQQRLLAGWLRSGVKAGMVPPPAAIIPPPVKADTTLFGAYSGRYEIAEGVFFQVTCDKTELFAGLADGDATLLAPASDSAFYYPFRNATLTFGKNGKGQVTGISWSGNGLQRNLPRIGAFINSMQHGPDPRTDLTSRIRTVLQALAGGVKADDNIPGIAPSMQKEYISIGPVHGLIDIKTLDYIYSENIPGHHFTRHGGEVSQILYYKLVSQRKNTYLMVYLTPDNQVTDFDYVDN
jgi:predicted metalloprotease with PDZ domain